MPIRAPAALQLACEILGVYEKHGLATTEMIDQCARLIRTGVQLDEWNASIEARAKLMREVEK